MVVGAGEDLRPSSGVQPARKKSCGENTRWRGKQRSSTDLSGHMLTKWSDCELCQEKLVFESGLVL